MSLFPALRRVGSRIAGLPKPKNCLYSRATRRLSTRALSGLLNEKVATVLSDFKALDAPEPQISPRPPIARMRAEFRVWHDGETSILSCSSAKAREPIKITAFPFGSEEIQTVLEPLRVILQSNALLRTKLFQVEFLSTLSGECLVTLIYHRKLDDVWVREATQAEKALNIKLIGRSRGQKLVVSDDWVTETLQVEGRSFIYKQPELLIQPNAKVNQEMPSWSARSKYDQDLLGSIAALVTSRFRCQNTTDVFGDRGI